MNVACFRQVNLACACLLVLQRYVVGVTLRSDGFLSEVARVEIDSELASDLGLDAAVVSRHGPAPDSGGGGGGPATLAEYCAGPSHEEKKTKFREGTKVKANWEGYGTMYPGTITDRNRDGTVDIKYDDGFTEKRVDTDDTKVRKKQSLLGVTSWNRLSSDPANDPACQLTNFIEKVKPLLKKVKNDISMWSATKRATMAKEDAPEPVKSKPAAAPSAAPPAKDSETELEALKKQLEERDAYIKELELEFETNQKDLAQFDPVPAAAAPSAAGSTAAAPSAAAPLAVDDLIAYYKGRIAQSEARIEELLGTLRDQENKFRELGAFRLSLQDISNDISALEDDVAEARKKRDDLEKAGKLDPELEAIIDSIMKAFEKIRSKVDRLIAAEAKAKAEKEQAEKEVKEAAEAARKRAKEEGRDPDEAAAEAETHARKNSKERRRKAELETIKAAKELDEDLKGAEKAATKLDTGLHPHGEKWWRYRYEHSYIESLIMIFICFIYLFWDLVLHRSKKLLKKWILSHRGLAEMDEDSAIVHQTHGDSYVLWLNILCEQMMVCLLVFLTVWLIAKTHLAEIFPIIIRPSNDLHVPATAWEYRCLALDICTIFCFAIVFYFMLMLPVAHDTRVKTRELELFERTPEDTMEESDFTAFRHRASIAAMGAVAGSVDEFEQVKKHFETSMREQMLYSKNDTYKEISKAMGEDLWAFPLALYLKVDIRKQVGHFFKFDWRLWLPVVCLFFVFMMLHRFAHVAYVRIMLVFCVMTLCLIAAMGWFIKRMAKEIEKSAEVEGPEGPQFADGGRAASDFNLGFWVLGFLHFSMFVVCYGVARMICQPWMWELHFWPVLSLTIIALLSALLFVLLVTPAIPSFCTAMALPPYMGPKSLHHMLVVAKVVEERRELRKLSPNVPKLQRKNSTTGTIVMA